MTTSTISPITELLTAILDGSQDDNLEALQGALTQRRKDVRDRQAKVNGLLLKPGARVKLHGLSPKFLNGEIVEIVTVERTKAGVKSIEGVTGFRAHARIGVHGSCPVPLSCVTPVD